MQEAFLHFVWQYQYFEKSNLTTTESAVVNIIKTGSLNTNAGPDFLEAQVSIDGINWNGSVEIHLKSSDWDLHKHQNDAAYQNVVLHVVWQHDKEVKRSDGTHIPTITLEGLVDKQLHNDYNRLIKNPTEIPCSDRISEVEEVVKLSMIDKAVTNRLYDKAQKVLDLQYENNTDWNETTYQLLTSNFGFKINTEAFMELGKSLPLMTLLKHRDNIMQMEALLFGQAGFLEEEIGDEYFHTLKKEYEFLKHKYQLDQRLNQFRWKFLRLRPANFPTVRIAQLATLLYKIGNLFDALTGNGSVDKLTNILGVKQSEYWLVHYNFGKKASRKMTGFGKSSGHNIIINTVIPLLVAYSRQVDDQLFMDRALSLLGQLPPENNVIIRNWKNLGMNPKSAFDTQALLQLNNNYCLKRKCLNCNIGVALIRRS